MRYDYEWHYFITNSTILNTSLNIHAMSSKLYLLQGLIFVVPEVAHGPDASTGKEAPLSILNLFSNNFNNKKKYKKYKNKRDKVRPVESSQLPFLLVLIRCSHQSFHIILYRENLLARQKATVIWYVS